MYEDGKIHYLLHNYTMPKHLHLEAWDVPLSMDIDFLGIWFPEIPQIYGGKLATILYRAYKRAPRVVIKEDIVGLNLSGCFYSDEYKYF